MEGGGGEWLSVLSTADQILSCCKGLESLYIYWILEKFNWTLTSFLSIYILCTGEVKIVQPHFYDCNYTPCTLHTTQLFSRITFYWPTEHFKRDNCSFRETIILRSTRTLQRPYTIIRKKIFPEMKLCGLSPNSYIHVFVSYLYFPTIDLPIL